MLVDDLKGIGIEQNLIFIWKNKGINVLTEIQEKAFTNSDLLNGKNSLVMAPTSSGKTFIGEVLSIRSAMGMRKAIYLVPYKAMADEKFQDFKEKYGELGVHAVISSGDYSDYDRDIIDGNFDIAVIVYEKLAQLMVHAHGVVATCGVLIVDEIQLIGDPSRGPKLEMILTKIKLASPQPQIIGLSATLGRLNGLDRWLNAVVIKSDSRPVPLWEGICDLSGKVNFCNAAEDKERQDCIVNEKCNDKDELLQKVVLSLVKEGNQILIFRSTKEACVNTAKALAELMEPEKLSQEIVQQLNSMEETDAREFLYDGLQKKVAYHTADLDVEERLLVEKMFRQEKIRVLVSTTTLAMGVNLPADVVIMADLKRWYSRQGTRLPIPVSEYKNCVGRAGRFGIRDTGISLIFAEGQFKEDQIRSNFIFKEPEDANSAIPRDDDFSHHVLNLVVSGLATKADDIIRIFKGSFAYQTFYSDPLFGGNLETHINQSLNSLSKSGLVEIVGEEYRPTEFGRIVIRNGISTSTFAILKNIIDRIDSKFLPVVEILYELNKCPEIKGLPPYIDVAEKQNWWKDVDTIVGGQYLKNSTLQKLLTHSYISEDENKVFKKTCLIYYYSKGKKTGELCKSFKVGHGVIRNLAEAISWLLDTLSEVARVGGLPGEFSDYIRRFSEEVKFGVPFDVVFVRKLRVPGITRDKTLRLIDNEKGLKLDSPEKILDATTQDVRGVIDPASFTKIQEAILANRKETFERRKKGHFLRLERLALYKVLIEELYSTKGTDFERAIEALLNSEKINLVCRRVTRQRSSESDIHLTHPDGLIIISATASDSPEKLISWNKTREVLGSDPGKDPINFVVVGKPDFEKLAITNADNIAKEQRRSILLLPADMLAEICIDIIEGSCDTPKLLNIFAKEKGYMNYERLKDIYH